MNKHKSINQSTNHSMLVLFQGGMKAVVWTDTFQVVIMFVGLFAILAQGAADHGGFNEIFNDMKLGGRMQVWKQVTLNQTNSI